MPKEVAAIAKNYMENPLEVAIGHKNQSNENIEHIYYTVSERDRYNAVKRIIDFNPSIYGLIFCRTRRETAAVAEKLVKEGYSAEPLHGELSQAQRDNAMRRFRSKSIQILVATDVAARGIDVDDITHVINYNLPDEIENYTHRSGRTARAGKKGESLVLVTPRESYKIKTLEKKLRTTFKKGTVPGAKEICEIQLMKLVDKVITTEVKEENIAEFLPAVMKEFEGLSTEEVVKKFVSAEFNRFIEYYNKASDLNAKDSGRGRDSDRGERGERRDRDRGERGGRRNDENKTRFFVNLGNRDGLNPGGLLRVICDSTGLKSDKVGRIDILASFSFFEADNEHADDILAKVNGSDYEGHDVSIEVTKKKSGDGGGSRSGGGGGSRSGGGAGHRGGGGGGSRSFGNRSGGGSRDGGSRDGGNRRSSGGFSGGGNRRSRDSGSSEGSGNREGGRRDGGSREFGNRERSSSERSGGERTSARDAGAERRRRKD
jgi:ATP-dependent RNA helicase DeaD